jgi:glutathionylspermidine amidase/synthetase
MIICSHLKERLGLDNLPIAPFGSTLGISPPNVPAYSCDYNTSTDSNYNSTIDLSYKKNVYTGMKWQCVEFARRWLILTKGISFADVDFAYNIFDLPSFYSLVDNAVVPITPCRDGESKMKPEVGTLIIWKEEVDHTGHVAVVTNVGEDFIDIGT